MSNPQKPIHIRLTPELAAKLDQLCKTIPSLPRVQLLRLLLASAMAGSLEEQVDRITKQLVHPDALPKPPTSSKSRLNAFER